MSRFDAEYSPAEHHDLDRIEPAPIGSPPTWTPYCACGWSSPDRSTRSAAYRAWDRHREDQL